jgi:GT2 family glycosyltransferase
VTKSISVVIPNYNGENIIGKCIETATKACEKAADDFEVIVSDDNSSDNSVELIKENYPHVILIENKKNGGFSKNVNIGLRKASKDLVFIMNSDLEVEPDYFTHQVKYFEDEKVFSVMGAVYDSDSKELVRVGIYPIQDFFGFIKTIRKDGYDYKEPTYIYFSSGSNALVDRKKLEELDYFAEFYSPYYGEDNDLGHRAWRKGWSSIYEPKSHCYHEGSTTIKSSSSKKRIRLISRRNKIIFHNYHLDGISRVLFKLKFYIDFLTRWMIGDFQYYQGLKLYYSLKKEIDLHKKENPLKYKTSETLQTILRKMNEENLLHERVNQ